MERAKGHPLPARDPIGGGALVITEVEAVDSGVTIRGRFEVPRFARLSPDQARYLETFLRCRGMLNSVERELGISYPTARARLDAVLKALDLHAVREDSSGIPAPPPTPEEPAPEPTFKFHPSPEMGLEGEPLEPQEPMEAPTRWEDEPESTIGFEAVPDEEPEAEGSAPIEIEPQAPRRSREELLSLLERGEITVEELKAELAGKA